MSLQKVDLPLPFAPSSAMRSSGGGSGSRRSARACPSIAGRDAFQRDERRRQAAAPGCGRSKASVRPSTMAAIGSIFASALQPRLRLARLRGLGAEAVDEGLQVLALGLLLARALRLQRLLLATLAGERGVAAAIERQLAAGRDAGCGRRTVSSRSRSWLTISTVCG